MPLYYSIIDSKLYCVGVFIDLSIDTVHYHIPLKDLEITVFDKKVK